MQECTDKMPDWLTIDDTCIDNGTDNKILTQFEGGMLLKDGAPERSTYPRRVVAASEYVKELLNSGAARCRGCTV